MKLTINNTSYPCSASLGAMRLFKKETGKELSEVQPQDLSLQAVYIYCCCKSACRRDKIEMPLECDEFLDYITLDVLNAFKDELNAEAEAQQTEAEKVTPKAKKKSR